MSDATKVIERINADRYRWIDIQYTDMLGHFKSITLPARMLEAQSFKEGVITVDRNSVLYEYGEDVVLTPDPSTFAIIPWEPSTVRLIASTNAPNDPRTILGKAQALEQKLKLGFRIGSELDYYLLDSMITDASKFSYGAYFDSRELPVSQYDGEFEKGMRRFQTMNGDIGRAVRLQIGDYADLTGVEVYSMHHEKGRMQHEVALAPAPLLKAADDFVTIKYLAKNSAMLVGAIASFAPKLMNEEPMSKAHVSISAWKADDNVFLDMGGERLSKEGTYFMAGLADHARALSAFMLPSTASYKEQVHIDRMRALDGVVKVPKAIRGEVDKRIEYRLADPSLNPYIAYAALLAAGADGISKKLAFDDSKDVAPPRSLAEALSALISDSDFLAPIFGEEFIHAYVELKEREIKEQSSRMTSFEVSRYQNV
ncbi:MAG: glutamine synthetase family protein [Candidatus Micrarchaeia archaeon]